MENENMAANATEQVDTTIASGEVNQTETVTEQVETPVVDTKQKTKETSDLINKRAEALAEKKSKELEAQYAPYKDIFETLKKSGLGNDPNEIKYALMAQIEDKDIEEVKKREAEISEKVKEQLENNSELAELRQFKTEAIMRDELSKVKLAHPEVTASTMQELDESLDGKLIETALLAAKSGLELDITDIYDMLTAKQVKKAPPSTGDIKGSTTKAEKEFYTNEELDNLTSKDLDDPKIFEKAMRSLKKL